MQFIEAKKKLKRLAKGRYHRISFKLTDFGEHISYPLQTECEIYIDGEHIFSGDTFREAFKAREDALKPKVTEELPKDLPQDLPEGESSR